MVPSASSRRWAANVLILVYLLVPGSCTAPTESVPDKWKNAQYKLPRLSSAEYAVVIRKDVAYLGHQRNEECDLYLPANLPPNLRVPAIVIIHGGGWKGGDKTDRREVHLGTMFARHGYVCMSINYLLGSANVVSWPQNLYDCKSAVRFLRKNAERLQINPAQIGAIGGSAGGHLSAMVGVTGPDVGLEPPDCDRDVSSRVQAVVDLYGIVDLPTWPRDYTADVLGATFEEDPSLWKLASPINHITSNDPPVLILHGMADKTVSYKQSIKFAEALQAESVPCRLMLISQAPHTFALWSKYCYLTPLIIDFFDEHLKKTESP